MSSPVTRISIWLLLGLCPGAFGAEKECAQIVAPTYETGLQIAIEKIAKLRAEHPERPPLFVVVYGWPDSGKSILIKHLGDHFKTQGLEVKDSGGGFAPRRRYYELIHAQHMSQSEEAKPPKFLYLIHVTAPRGLMDAASPEPLAEPDAALQEFFGRSADLHIGIYNSRSRGPYPGDYDLQIANQGAAVKVAN